MKFDEDLTKTAENRKLVLDILVNGFSILFFHNNINGTDYLKIVEDIGNGGIKKAFDEAQNASEAFETIVKKFVNPDDVEKMLLAVNKENYLKELQNKKMLSVYFRWKEKGDNVYSKLNIIKLEDDRETPKNIIIGIRNINNSVSKVLDYSNKNKYFALTFFALCREYESVYYVNLDTGELVPYEVSGRIESMFGDSFYKMNYDDAWKKYVEKAVFFGDKEKMSKFLSREYIREEFKDKDVFTKIYLNNENKYCEMKCVRTFSETGEPVAVMGFSVSDARIRAEKNAQKTKDFQLSLLDGLAREFSTVMLIHPDRTIEKYRTYDSPMIKRLVRFAEEVGDYNVGIQGYIDQCIISEERERVKNAVMFETLIQKIPEVGSYNVTYKRHKGKGKTAYYQMCFSKALNQSGAINIVLAFRDVDKIVTEEIQQKKALQKAIEQRDIDGLTRIRNRYSYENKIQEYKKLKNKTISCIYIDVDGLHDINNLEGHDAGDMLIKTVARNIVETWDDENAFRIGGDEFVVFLFDYDEKKLLSEIRSFKKNLSFFNYSVSVGQNTALLAKTDMHDFIVIAEKRMYEEKKIHGDIQRSRYE